MKIFWNSGEKNLIQGLDIIGGRQIDQNVEKPWVAGFTTLTIRARYLTLLPWIISEYYDKELSESNEGVYDENIFRDILRRLEFIVLATSRLEAETNPNYNINGLLGAVNFAEDYRKLIEEGQIELNFDSGGALYGNYAAACRFFGLLANPPTNTEIPVVITPRGKEIQTVRKENPLNKFFVDKIINGGLISLLDLEKGISFFSVNSLLSTENASELKLLTEAFFKSYHASAESGYKRFVSTANLILSYTKEKSFSNQELILSNYKKIGLNETTEYKEVEVSFFEYDLMRRVHYGFELLLESFTDTLIELGSANINNVINEWQASSLLLPVLLLELWNNKSFAYDSNFLSLYEIISSKSDDIFLESIINPNPIHALTPNNKALYALTLISACYLQSKSLYKGGLLKFRSGDFLESAFEIISSKSKSIALIIEELLILVLKSHLSTTWRKMSQGQGCSLRFYYDGSVFRPTGNTVYANYSGDRIGNVMSMLSDIGLLKREASGKYSSGNLNSFVLDIDEDVN